MLRLLAVVCLTLALAGCRPTDPRTTIRFWAMGREAEVVGALIPQFEREHPNLRVELQQVPWTAAHEKLLTAYAADALPDVFQLGNTWVPEFAELRALEPLRPYVEASGEVDPADYFPGIWETNVVDDTLYGVPWYVDTRLLFYRKDLLAAAGYAQPPKTWDEWRAMMEAIKRQRGEDRYAVMLPLNEFEQLLSLALQQKAPLIRDGRGNFDSPEFRRALGFYVGMFEADLAPPMSETQISNVWDEFFNGMFVFYVSGPWNIREFRQRAPKGLEDAWGTAPLPGPDGPGAGIAGGTSLVLFRHSPRKREAWAFIEYLSRPDVQVKFHAQIGDLPPRRSAWDAPALRRDPYAGAFRDQLERVVPTPKVLEWERIVQEMRLASERVVRGGQSQDAAVRQLDAHVDALLEKRRWVQARARRGRAMKPSLAGWVFVAPALAVLGVFFGLPVFAALLLSLSDFDLYALADWNNLRFVGLDNYAQLLQTPLFWKSLGNTFYFVLVGVPLSIGVSLAAALLLNAPVARFRPFFRTALFAPVVTTLVAVAVIWRYLFHTRYGLVNWTLGHAGIAPIDWLGDPDWAMPTIIALAVWKNFGYNMVIFLAGLQAIPQDLYEAARIDGASRWRQFRHITLPMLGPVLMVVGVITVAGYFQLFAEPYVMTRGDPLQSTVSVLYFMFEEGFRWWNLGRASAVAFMLFLIIFAITTVMMRFGRRRGLV